MNRKFADNLQIEDSAEYNLCRKDVDRAFRALTEIPQGKIPWKLLEQQVNIAVSDALSTSYDRLERSGIIYPENLGTDTFNGDDSTGIDNNSAATLSSENSQEGVDDHETYLENSDRITTTGKFRSMIKKAFGGRK